jgi:hypothetical protein
MNYFKKLFNLVTQDDYLIYGLILSSIILTIGFILIISFDGESEYETCHEKVLNSKCEKLNHLWKCVFDVVHLDSKKTFETESHIEYKKDQVIKLYHPKNNINDVSLNIKKTVNVIVIIGYIIVGLSIFSKLMLVISFYNKNKEHVIILPKNGILNK